jgi:hypothetical protein
MANVYPALRIEIPHSMLDPRTATARRALAQRIAVVGAVMGCAIGATGLVPISIALDIALTPPLVPPMNYGQFGTLSTLPAMYLAASGATFGLLLYIHKTGVYLCQAAQLLIAYFVKLTLLPNETWDSTWIIASILLLSIPLLTIPFVDLWAKNTFHAATEAIRRDPPVIA